MAQVNKYAKGLDPVEAMYRLAWALKAIQFTSYGIYLLSLGPLELSNITFIRFLLFAALFGYGQLLNAAVFKTIKKDGTYYGCRLGKKIQWVEGFPFNQVPHPQYVGSVLSFWGMAFLFYNAEHHVSLFAVAVLMTVYYTITGYVEETM
jgi:methylene-fatty-acyl-phospholipid synthase